MPSADITDADGKVVATLNAPDGASHRDIMNRATEIKQRMLTQARQTKPVAPSLDLVKQTLNTPGAKDTERKILGTIVRVGGGVAGAMLGQPFLGGVAAEGAAELIEGKGINPAKIAVGGIVNRFAPGVEGSIPGGLAKGAAFGMGSVTLDAIAEGKGPPTVGRLAIGGLTGGILAGAGRKFLRPSIYEISHANVSEESSAILSGEARVAESSPGVREGVEEVKDGLKQVRLAGINPTETAAAQQVYRNRLGRFSSLTKTPELTEPQAGFRADLEEQQLGEQAPLFEDKPLDKLTRPQRMMTRDVRGGYIGIPKGWFSRTERATGVPVYSEVFNPTENANVRRAVFEQSRANELSRVFGGVRHRGRETYQAFLEATDRDAISNRLQMKVGDRIRTTELQGSWERMFKAFGLEDGGLANATSGPRTRAEEYLQKILPNLRATKDQLEQEGEETTWGAIVDKAYPINKPRSLEFFEPGFRSGAMGVGDTDSLGIVTRHLNEGSYRTFVAPTVNAVRAKYVTPFIDHTTGGFKQNEGFASTVNHYLNQVEGAGDPTGRDLGLFITSVARKLHIPGINHSSARDISNLVIASQYGSTLGFRPGPLLRNMTQTVQTGYSELGRYWFSGARQAATPVGRAMAERLGLFEGETSAVSEVSSAVGGGKFQTGMRAIGKSLSWYKNADDVNRAIMGLGQWSRAQAAIRRSGGDVNKFIDLAWLDSDIFHPAEQKVLQTIARSGDLNEAARRSAVAVADNTQWVYRSGNRSPLLTGTAGRAFGGFGTWSSFYGNYLRRLLPTGDSAARTAVWNKGSIMSKNAVRFSRFALANAALVGASAELGKLVGNEDNWKRALSWNLFGALAYTGSPLAEETRNALRASQELSQGDYGPDTKAAVRGLQSFVPIPGAYLAKDFAHLAKPDKGKGEAILRVLGVQPRRML